MQVFVTERNSNIALVFLNIILMRELYIVEYFTKIYDSFFIICEDFIQ